MSVGVGDEGLPDRAGRIDVLDGAVLERPVLVADDRLPLGAADAAGEDVRVEGRGRDEREDLAGLRVEGDRRSDLVAEVVVREPLEVEVDVQDERVPGKRVDAVELGDLAAERVDDEGPEARGPREEVLVGGLDAVLPDRLARARRGRARGELVGARLAEVPEEVRRDRPLRVDAALGRLDDELGVLEGVRLDGADLGDGQVVVEDDRDEVVARPRALDAAAEVVQAASEEARHEAKGAVDVLRLPPVQEERERGLVLGEELAVAIEDEAARGADRDGPLPVVLRLAGVLVAAEDLVDPVDARAGARGRRTRPQRAGRSGGEGVGGPRGRSRASGASDYASFRRRRAARASFQG